MSGDDAPSDSRRQTASGAPGEPTSTHRRATGLDDPRAVAILTAEHWSLLSARTLGYQEMFARATVFIGVLSGIIVDMSPRHTSGRSPTEHRSTGARWPGA